MLTHEETELIKNLHTWALPRTKDSKIIQTNNWFQVVSEDYKSPAFNEVLFSSCLDSEIENKIIDTMKLYRDIGTDFKWCVHPHSKPGKTPDLLLKYGFINWQSRTMYARPFELDLLPSPNSIEVRKVDPREMNLFLDLFCKCWNINPDEHELMKQQLRFDNNQTTVHFERFLAFADGEAVGVASMVRNNSCGYLHATAVLPQFYGRGIYRALVNARMKILKANGVELAVTGAREKTSAPRLERMGFNTAWQLNMFLKKHQV